MNRAAAIGLALCAAGASPAARAGVIEAGAAIRSIEEACAAAHYPAPFAWASCLDEERSAWARYAPQALPYFDEWARILRRIRAQLAAGTITMGEFEGQFETARGLFLSQVERLAATEPERRGEAPRGPNKP